MTVLTAGLLAWLPGDGAAQSNRNEEAGAGEFIPGSSSIEENAILRRMERELGQEFTPKSNRETEIKPEKETRRKQRSGPPRFNVTVVTGGDLRIKGRIALTQPALELTENQNGVAVRHRIPVPEIGQIEFLDWRAVRLHREPGTQGRRILYFPTRCRLTRRDQTRLEGDFSAFDWLEFRMQSGLTFGSYRTYFSVDPTNPDQNTGPAASATTEAAAGEASAAANPPAGAESSPTPPEKPATRSGAKPGTLAEWNQQTPAAVPPEIVRSIEF
ncbi:MAG: hypothetical protein RIF32_23825, partial [Leptospirales bacterium]